jgi:glycosyltransferase involved in cell wall biosynthesis
MLSNLKKQKKKVYIINESLCLGGVEQVLVNIANNLDDSKFDVELILFSEENDLAISLNNNVKINYIDKLDNESKKGFFGKVIKNIKNMLYIRQQIKSIIKDKDAVILQMNARYLFINLPLLFIRNKKIGWFHGCIEQDNNRIDIVLNYILLSQFSVIFNVSQSGKYSFDKKLFFLRHKNKLLNNSFDIDNIQKMAQDPVKYHDYIVAVGRLDNKYKGFNVLVEAMSLLKKDGFNEKLFIVGEGNDRAFLEKQIIDLGLENNVFLVGFDCNPYKWMKHSKLFLFSSLSEGFPLVLGEALACECPIISTDCKYGPSEILDNGKFGILVPVNDSYALKESISQLLTDTALSDKYRLNALQRAFYFSNGRIIPELEREILSL